ncbi:MAG: AI-2E family transporter [Gemmatimonadota bacterium]|jgi:predicted PurR-regulated permease PerM|nr:AI-2E family transporter [Gemmatimonadota bacterium]
MADNLVRRITWRTADVARVLSLGLVFLFLWRFFWMVYSAIFIALLAVLVAIVLYAPARYLSRWIPFRISFTLTTLAFLGALVALLLAIIPQVARQVTELAIELPEAIRDAGDWLAERSEMARDPRVIASVNRQLADFAGRFIPFAYNAISVAMGSFAILIMAVFLAWKPDLYREMILNMTPPPNRVSMARVYDRTGESLKTWVLGKAATMLMVGIGTWVGLRLFGIPGALALAAFAGLLEFVPNLGPVIASVPAIMAGFLISPSTAAWVALFYFGLQQVQNGITVPLIEQRAVNVPPAALLVWQVMLAVGFGILGLFVATPLLAIVMTATRIFYMEPSENHFAKDRREAIGCEGPGMEDPLP